MGSLFLVTANLQPGSFHRSRRPAVKQETEVLSSENRHAYNTIHYYSSAF